MYKGSITEGGGGDGSGWKARCGRNEAAEASGAKFRNLGFTLKAMWWGQKRSDF